LRPFGKFYGRLVWVLLIWYIFPILVFWTIKVWQPCKFTRPNGSHKPGTTSRVPERALRRLC
jgi:hypothetical protein